MPKQYTQGNSNFLAGFCDGWGHCECSLAGAGDQAGASLILWGRCECLCSCWSQLCLCPLCLALRAATLGRSTCSSVLAASSGWLMAWPEYPPECNWGSALFWYPGEGFVLLDSPGDRPGVHGGTEYQTCLEGYLWTLWGVQRCVGCVLSRSGHWNCTPLAPIIFRIASSSLGTNI